MERCRQCRRDLSDDDDVQELAVKVAQADGTVSVVAMRVHTIGGQMHPTHADSGYEVKLGSDDAYWAYPGTPGGTEIPREPHADGR